MDGHLALSIRNGLNAHHLTVPAPDAEPGTVIVSGIAIGILAARVNPMWAETFLASLAGGERSSATTALHTLVTAFPIPATEGF